MAFTAYSFVVQDRDSIVAQQNALIRSFWHCYMHWQAATPMDEIGAFHSAMDRLQTTPVRGITQLVKDALADPLQRQNVPQELVRALVDVRWQGLPGWMLNTHRPAVQAPAEIGLQH